MAHFNFEKLRVFKGDARPKDAQSLLPPHAGSIPDDLVLPTPHWDPVLANDSVQRRRLYLYLLDLDIVGAHMQCKAPTAIFFVHKKDGCIHKVVDGCLANLLQRRPPRVCLDSSHAMSELDLSDASPTRGGFGGVAEFEVSLADRDIRDAYYQFCIREVGSWFCREKVRAGDYEISRAWYDFQRRFIDVDPDSLVWLCMDAMCMGWSRAAIFCQESLAFWANESFDGSRHQHLREHRVAPRICRGLPVVAV